MSYAGSGMLFNIYKYIFEPLNISPMSKDPKSIKRKVVTNRTTSTPVTRRTVAKAQASFPLLFTKQNYQLMAIGFGLIVVGLLLMLGGNMKDPNVWDESVIYSFRRTVLAPFVILTGLAVEVYAIFKR